MIHVLDAKETFGELAYVGYSEKKKYVDGKKQTKQKVIIVDSFLLLWKKKLK